MACVPAARVKGPATKPAAPAASRAAVPSTIAPSLKVAVPVGVPLPGVPALTAAVSVTACPYAREDAPALTTTTVASGLTVSSQLADALGPKLLSPP